MPAPKQWDDEESSSGSSASAPNSPPVTAVQRRRVFEDEEDDSDVLDSWDAAEDSEVEREKAKKAVEAKAKADAEAAALKKSKKERVAEHQAERARRRLAGEDTSDDEDETPAERRERLRRTEKDADLAHAQDLFGEVGGVSNGRKATTAGAAVAIDSNDPNNTVNIADLPLFNPTTKTQFASLRETLGPIITSSSKKAHYSLFLQEFAKQLAKELPSDQIKKVASSLTALGNEKMKEEKAAASGGKKSKAAKTKISVVTTRANTTDMDTYDDAFGDDDFM